MVDVGVIHNDTYADTQDYYSDPYNGAKGHSGHSTTLIVKKSDGHCSAKMTA